MDTKLLKLRIIECGTLVNTNVIDCRVKPNPREFGQAILSGGENAEADRIFHFFNDPFISRCVLIIMINTVSYFLSFLKMIISLCNVLALIVIPERLNLIEFNWIDKSTMIYYFFGVLNSILGSLFFIMEKVNWHAFEMHTYI